MIKKIYLIDYSAIILLCSLGLGSILVVLIAGTPGYGALSKLWTHLGILNLFTASIVSFCMATVLLRRHYILGSAHRHCLLMLLVFTILPTVLFSIVLIGRGIYGGG